MHTKQTLAVLSVSLLLGSMMAPLQAAPATVQVTVAAAQLPGAVSTTGTTGAAELLFAASAAGTAAEAVWLGSGSGSEPLPQAVIKATVITELRRVKR